MNIKIDISGQNYVIRIGGRLDTTTAQDFDNEINYILSKENIDITIDLENLIYISSSGLRSLIALLKAVKKNGSTLKIINMRDEIKEIFEMTGFNTLFIIE